MSVCPAADGTQAGAGRIPVFSLALASAAALAYEILLTRLFAIIQWHHFAYMIISLALLGYGLSGTVLALSRTWLLDRFDQSYPLCLGLFAVTMPVCFLIAQTQSLHPELLLWRPDLFWRLPLVYLLLAVPFFFMALAVAILLTRHSRRAGSVYAADLLGAGIGSVAVIGLLFWLWPERVLWVLGCAAAFACLIAVVELSRFWQPASGIALLALLLPLFTPAGFSDLRISPFKGLPQAMQVSGAELLLTRSSPQGLISVVGNAVIPLRYAPGLSLNSTSQPPAQLGVFTDAEAFTVINAWSGTGNDTGWLDQSTNALAYRLITPRSILVAEAGGGTGVLRALALSGAGPLRIDVLESNPQISELVVSSYAEFAGSLFAEPGVSLYTRELRGHLSGRGARYDLIDIPIQGGPGGVSGLSALSENYLLTVEAFAQTLRRIERAGFMSVSSWVQLPPRDTLRILATAAEALKVLGDSEPARRILLIRGWQTATLLVKGSPITEADVRAAREFCEQRGFDLVFYPGMRIDEANRFNRLARAEFHEAAVALLGADSEAFRDRYKFDLSPATDDRPFFFRFSRWQSLPEIVALRERGGMGLAEAGHMVLLATLGQAIVLTLLLVLLPLAFSRAGMAPDGAPWRGRVLGYFALLGLAFMFVEIAFIQKFLLFLHHPVYSVTTVLASFLVFAGIGSASANRLVGRYGGRLLVLVVWGIALLGIAYLFALPGLTAWMAGSSLALRLLVAVLLVAPMATLMGMPFPIGLTRLARHAPGAVPWAWAVNGCASVIAAILATLIAMDWGFRVLVILALAMYLLCATVAPRHGMRPASERQ